MTVAPSGWRSTQEILTLPQFGRDRNDPFVAGATPIKPNSCLGIYIVELFEDESFRAYVPAALLFRQLTSFVECRVGYWPQRNTHMIAGVTSFALANQRAFRNQVGQVTCRRRW